MPKSILLRVWQYSDLRLELRPETHIAYICGHPGTVDNTVDRLTRRGFKPDRDLKREKYYP